MPSSGPVSETSREVEAGSNLTMGRPAERLFRGFVYPFSTIGYMLRRPVLWGYAVLPVIITASILVLVLAALFAWGGHLTEWVWSRPEQWYWQLLWYPFHVLLLALLFAIGAVTLPSLVSSPFNKVLSRRTERIETGREPIRDLRSLVSGLPSTLLEELKKVFFLLAVHASLLVLVLIPVVGQVLYPLLAWLWTVLWLTGQNLDFSLSRHQHAFMDTPRTIRRNLAVCVGFGLAVFVALFIPFFNFLFVPVAVVAATRLFLDLKKSDGIVDSRRLSAS